MTENVKASDWWRSATVYQIYPRSFADSTGDGMGDLPGITKRLPELEGLFLDAIWLSPFFTSPQKDAGYDVADYCGVDPRFGTLEDFDELLAESHRLGMRVLIDLVPNHTSDEHPWFRDAVAAGPGSEKRSHYLFREGRGVVAQGSIGPDGVFHATEVLAKHDENYMPPEVAHALSKAEAEKAARSVVPSGAMR